MSKKLFACVSLFMLMAAPALAEGQFIPTQTLSLDGAKVVLTAAEAEARRQNLNVAISIVDPAGGQVLFARLDGVGRLPLEIALEKAKTAAKLGRPTKAIADLIAGGNTAFLAIEGVMPLEGGIPILVNGQVVGAVGVSGATSQQDAQIAQAGIDALLR